MINRRQFVCAAAAGPVLLGRSKALAATYDLIIRGGRVIDPSVGIDAVRDVAVAGGKIAAVEANIAGDATETIDARNKIVTPGLIDIHTHAGRSKEGPPMCLRDGVTGWVDAGSGGADNMTRRDRRARSAADRLLLGQHRAHRSRAGRRVTRPEPRQCGYGSRRHLTQSRCRYRRQGAPLANVTGPNDLEALRRAQAAAGDLPVMIHVGHNYSPLRALLALLKRGDIVTHIYAPGPHSLLDERGRLFPEVMAARRRGIVFDFGNGVVDHFDWDTVEKATKQDFWPDTFSTDWNVMSRTTGVVDLPNVMSKFIMFGMPLSQIVAAATTNAARVFPSFDDRGTLNVDAPADVAIMELREGTFEFLDNYKGTRVGRQRLFPIATVLAGKSVPRA